MSKFKEHFALQKNTTEKRKQEEQNDDLYNLSQGTGIQFMNEQHWQIHFKNVSFVVNQDTNGYNKQKPCG